MNVVTVSANDTALVLVKEKDRMIKNNLSSGRLKPWLFPSTGTLLEVQVPTDRMSNKPREIWPLLV